MAYQPRSCISCRCQPGTCKLAQQPSNYQPEPGTDPASLTPEELKKLRAKK